MSTLSGSNPVDNGRNPSHVPRPSLREGGLEAQARPAEIVLDELSELLETARAMPMSASCVVNRAHVLNLVDEVRGALPIDLAAARAILEARDDILEDGRREAERVRDAARVEQSHLVGMHEVTQVAIAEAAAIRHQAQAEAERMRRETDSYVTAKLLLLEDGLKKTLETVQRGRERIEEDELTRKAEHISLTMPKPTRATA